MIEKFEKYEKAEIAAHIDDCLSPLFGSIKEQNKQTLIAPITDFFHRAVADFIAVLIDVEAGEETRLDFFKNTSYALVLKGHTLETKLNDAAITIKVKSCFRSLLGPWIYDSVVLKRAFEKPRGYPGDYQLLEIIYNNVPVTDKNSRVGVFSDLHFLSDPLAIAVRERKDKMRQILSEFIARKKGTSANILNFASGSARETRELLKESNISSVNFSLIDFDDEALDFTRSQLKDVRDVKFSFIKEDIIRISLKNTPIPAIKDQDLVYSIGLIDYLPDRILKSFIKYSYDLLRQNGQLVLSHKDHTKVSTLVENWYCEWTFYERTKGQVLDIIQSAGIPKDQIKLVPMKNEAAYYLIADKK